MVLKLFAVLPKIFVQFSLLYFLTEILLYVIVNFNAYEYRIRIRKSYNLKLGHANYCCENF